MEIKVSRYMWTGGMRKDEETDGIGEKSEGRLQMRRLLALL